MNRSIIVALAAALAWSVSGAAFASDEFSGADKLRTLYSAEFRFTQEGLPVVPVAIADGLSEVTVTAAGAGLRLLPDGDGGPEVHADSAWKIRTVGKTSPAKLRYWTVVWRGTAGQGATAAEEARMWKERGEKSRVFEQGTLFGVAGEVLDRRELIVGVGSAASFEDAEKGAARLAKKGKVSASGVYTELLDRPHGTLEAVGLSSGVRVRNEGALWFSVAGDLPLRVVGTGAASKADGSYFGRVYVTLDRHGGLAAVNAVSEDRLLAGLVPAEIFPSAPDEALKAQAVAARGELLTKIGTRHLGDPFRLCSRTHCQVYSGAGKEHPRTTAAVKATRGEVLFIQDGTDLVDTVYSANCGGHSEHNENAWPDMHPYPSLRGHRDAAADPKEPFPAGVTEENVARFIDNPPRAYCAAASMGSRDRFRWTVTRSASELSELLGRFRLGEVKGIEVLKRGVSGRAREVRIVGSARSEVVTGELRIRQTFGGLRSSLFLVDVANGAATFRGAGFGHGVGLCQTGSIGMAESGKTYKEILRHYYLGSVLRKLW